MQNLELISEKIRQVLDERTAAREKALTDARALIRKCANSIRAVHREERDLAMQDLEEAGVLAESLKKNLVEYPDIYFEGYTQDALKEYAEAWIVFSLTGNGHMPPPDELGLEYSTYLKGMAEAIGELRRRSLDILRLGHSEQAEQLLEYMDHIFTVLVTMDYPDAVTGGLRRLTDIARSIIERTRGDMTISLRQEKLEAHIRSLEAKLAEFGDV